METTLYIIKSDEIYNIGAIYDLLSDKMKVLFTHFCSNDSHAERDLTSGERHEILTEMFGSYEVKFISYDDYNKRLEELNEHGK